MSRRIRIGSELFSTNIFSDSTTGQRALQIVELSEGTVIVQGHRFTESSKPAIEPYVESMKQQLLAWLQERYPITDEETFDEYLARLRLHADEIFASAFELHGGRAA